jgi:hypothetical protein
MPTFATAKPVYYPVKDFISSEIFNEEKDDTNLVNFVNHGDTSSVNTVDINSNSLSDSSESSETEIIQIEKIRLYNTEDQLISGDYSYVIVDGNARITAYNGTETEIIIPDKTENGTVITSVAPSAFFRKHFCYFYNNARKCIRNRSRYFFRLYSSDKINSLT